MPSTLHELQHADNNEEKTGVFIGLDVLALMNHLVRLDFSQNYCPDIINHVEGMTDSRL